MMDQLFKFIALGMVASSISFGYYAFFYFPPVQGHVADVNVATFCNLIHTSWKLQ